MLFVAATLGEASLRANEPRDTWKGEWRRSDVSAIEADVMLAAAGGGGRSDFKAQALPNQMLRERYGSVAAASRAARNRRLVRRDSSKATTRLAELHQKWLMG